MKTLFSLTMLAAYLALAVFVEAPILLIERSTAATSPVGIPGESDWIDYGDILLPGAEGEWDHLLYGGFAFTILPKDGQYFLYYQGSEYYREDFDPTVMWRAIGVAVSSDGIAFRKHPGNPVVTWFPTMNGEEGAVSSAVTMDEEGKIVLYYGANTEESATTVNADGRAAVSDDGITFQDQGIVLDHTDRSVWGYGDELFPVAALQHAGRWIVYYIPNGVPQSGQLGVAYGEQFDRLDQSRQVVSGGRAVTAWGTAGVVRLEDDRYGLVINHVRERRTEVRTFSPETPWELGPPVVVYRYERDQQGSLVLDAARRTWFQYYRYPGGYGVKLAPAGEPDATPPTPPEGLYARMIDESEVELVWESASDPETGIVQYVVYRDGVQIAAVKSTHLTEILPAGREKPRYQVAAVNLHGVEGAKSPPASPKTARCSD